jgi:hypothetical protein
MSESCGHTAALADHLIRTACAAALEWDGEFRLTFNISSLYFQDATMPGLFKEALRSTGFPLKRTQVEITETTLIGGIDPAIAAHAQSDLERARRGEPITPRLLPLPAARRTGLLSAAPARDDSGELLGLSLVITELPGPA